MQPFRLLLLPPEVTRNVVDETDMASLLRVRKTCRALHDHAASILTSDRCRILRNYVDDPNLLCEHLTEHRAVVGGLAATKFILRDHTMPSPTLDIYVSNTNYDVLECRLEEDLDLRMVAVATKADGNDDDFFEDHVIRVATFATPTRTRVIKVHTAEGPSALQPIAGAWTSALINWFSPEGFACGYPSLTLRRMAVSPRLDILDDRLYELFDHLCEQLGFEIARHATYLPRYAHHQTPDITPMRYACLSDIFLCHCQGRFFGDYGSLLTVYNLLNTNHDELRRRQLPPYGIGAAWRLWTTPYRCENACDYNDLILPDDLRVLLAVFIGVEFLLRG
ncbi:hypothetical protein OH77DRAFT_1523837 [Trametes cingulata]|nr:hypothetical protein OH77DRAFT_1523837 [Trametes cingulata]